MLFAITDEVIEQRIGHVGSPNLQALGWAFENLNHSAAAMQNRCRRRVRLNHRILIEARQFVLRNRTFQPRGRTCLAGVVFSGLQRRGNPTWP